MGRWVFDHGGEPGSVKAVLARRHRMRRAHTLPIHDHEEMSHA